MNVRGANLTGANLRGDRLTAWTYQTSLNHGWRGIIYVDDLSLFVMYGTNRIATSPDGLTWTLRYTATATFNGAAYGRGLIVVVSSVSPNVYVSGDGISWSPIPSPSTNWVDVTYSKELGLFCASGGSGGSKRIMTSPDGVTWTAQDGGESNSWQSITWGNGLFVTVSDSGVVPRVMTSPDGVNWTKQTHPSSSLSWSGITWSEARQLFVATALNGANSIMTSPDGVNWTLRSTPNTPPYRHIHYAMGLFVIVGNHHVLVSRNGIAWRLIATPNGAWAKSAYGAGLWVACQAGGSGAAEKIMISSGL